MKPGPIETAHQLKLVRLNAVVERAQKTPLAAGFLVFA
jgi:hypothetical protein